MLCRYARLVEVARGVEDGTYLQGKGRVHSIV